MAGQTRCDVCYVQFTSVNHRVRHTKAHCGIRMKCQTCLKSFSRRDAYNIHYRRKHSKEGPVPEAEVIRIDPTTVKKSCNISRIKNKIRRPTVPAEIRHLYLPSKVNADPVINSSLPPTSPSASSTAETTISLDDFQNNQVNPPDLSENTHSTTNDLANMEAFLSDATNSPGATMAPPTPLDEIETVNNTELPSTNEVNNQLDNFNTEDISMNSMILTEADHQILQEFLIDTLDKEVQTDLTMRDIDSLQRNTVISTTSGNNHHFHINIHMN